MNSVHIHMQFSKRKHLKRHQFVNFQRLIINLEMAQNIIKTYLFLDEIELSEIPFRRRKIYIANAGVSAKYRFLVTEPYGLVQLKFTINLSISTHVCLVEIVKNIYVNVKE